MVLDARTRSSIYEKLCPVLGPDDANALMSEFPSTEVDELVTRHFLRAEMAELRREMHTEIGQLRNEMHTEIGQLRNEMHTELSAVRHELGARLDQLENQVVDLRVQVVERSEQLTERLRQQTTIFVAAVFTAVGAAVTIAQLLT
ncbi:MAG: hypothetical protein N2037_12770 [Acidimicrobiales bacterium]|nr:hypothetical protein [Acidimicrobiales bacterium]